MKRLLSFFFLLIFITSTISAQKFVVVIDPGHGGKDPGAVRGSYKEKDINLAVATLLGKYIENKHGDTKVIYTRTSDVFVDLDKRANIANKAKANLFISVHVNSTAAKTEKSSGVETFILGTSRSAENLEVAKRENSVILLEDDYTKKYEGFDPKSPESYIIFEFMTNKYMEQSLDFADLVQRHMKEIAKRPTSRGVKQAGLLVLRKSSMPSVLVELGFINNPTEAAYMSSNSGQRALASSLFAAFEKYKDDFLKKEGTIAVKNSEPKKSTIEKTATVPEKKVETPRKEETKKPEKAQDTQSPKKDREINNGIKNFVIKKVKDNPDYSNTDENTQTTTSKQQSFVDKPVSEPAVIKENKEQKTITETKKTTDNVTSKKEEVATIQIPSNQIEYRVQFLVNPSKISTNSPRFKGLEPVSYYEDAGSFKYTYGSTTDYNHAINLQREVRKKFSDAFIVKFKNGSRIK